MPTKGLKCHCTLTKMPAVKIIYVAKSISKAAMNNLQEQKKT